jgi:hypothetical protein
VASASRTSDLARAFFRMALDLPGGDVLTWSAAGGWQHVDGSRVGLPNGVAVSGDRLFVADWSGRRLVRVDRATGHRDVVRLPHHPDNLSWTADGRLLVAGQIGSVGIAVGCLDGRTVRNCGQPWSVLAIDPDTLATTMVASGDGGDFGAASSAVLVGDTLVLGTWAGDRVLRRKP